MFQDGDDDDDDGQVSDCQLKLLSWHEQVNFQWYDDEVRFVLDQHC